MMISQRIIQQLLHYKVLLCSWNTCVYHIVTILWNQSLVDVNLINLFQISTSINISHYMSTFFSLITFQPQIFQWNVFQKILTPLFSGNDPTDINMLYSSNMFCGVTVVWSTDFFRLKQREYSLIFAKKVFVKERSVSL